MKLKNILNFSFIVCTFALAALFFCVPASAATIEVGPEKSFSEALDEAVDGDVINVNDAVWLDKDINKNITINVAAFNTIVIYEDITIENASINGCIIVSKDGKLVIGAKAKLSSAGVNSNALYVEEGTAILSGGQISVDGKFSTAVAVFNGNLNILDGEILAAGNYSDAIGIYGGGLNISGGNITVSGEGCSSIIAGEYDEKRSTITVTGGSITAEGIWSRGLQLMNSSLLMTNGTIYGEENAILSNNSDITVSQPAKIRSNSFNSIVYYEGNVTIDPICKYNNPATKDTVSFKMDITTTDTITLNIDDIGNKDIFYFDIPSDINVKNQFQFYPNLCEENALTYAELIDLKTYGLSGYSYEYHEGMFESDTGIIKFTLNIGMYYGGNLEEKQIKIVLLQKGFESLNIEPDVIAGDWKDVYGALEYEYNSADIYAGSSSVIISLYESIENSKIKAFEILQDGTNIPYKELSANKYKIDFTSISKSIQPTIKIKVRYEDETTTEKIIFLNRMAVNVSSFPGRQEGIYDIIASYTAHNSFQVEDPHLLVIYNYYNDNYLKEKIIEVKTFDISQYTPDEEEVYKVCIKEGLSIDDTSSNIPNAADVYLIQGDIGYDDETFRGVILNKPWMSIWVNFRF